MNDPPAVERVRVSLCRDDQFVADIDYATNGTTAALAADGANPLDNAPLQKLLALREIEAVQAHRLSLSTARHTLHSSERRFYRSRESIRDLRETLRTTFTCIHQSQVLIHESDQLIERSRTLECDYRRRQDVTELSLAAGPLGIH